MPMTTRIDRPYLGPQGIQVFLKNRPISCYIFAVLFAAATLLSAPYRASSAAEITPEVLAFYYGWYGNPQGSRLWRHWKRVDPLSKRVANAADPPAYGAYDSHDPAVVKRQVE